MSNVVTRLRRALGITQKRFSPADCPYQGQPGKDGLQVGWHYTQENMSGTPIQLYRCTGCRTKAKQYASAAQLMLGHIKPLYHP